MSRIILGVSNELVAWAALGTCTVTGYPATIETAVTVTADFGAVSAQGWDATFNPGQEVTASVGTATVTGYDATVYLGGTTPQTVIAQVGACTTVGYDAGIALGPAAIIIQLDAGICQVQGYRAHIAEHVPLNKGAGWRGLRIGIGI